MLPDITLSSAFTPCLTGFCVDARSTLYLNWHLLDCAPQLQQHLQARLPYCPSGRTASLPSCSPARSSATSCCPSGSIMTILSAPIHPEVRSVVVQPMFLSWGSPQGGCKRRHPASRSACLLQPRTILAISSSAGMAAIVSDIKPRYHSFENHLDRNLLLKPVATLTTEDDLGTVFGGQYDIIRLCELSVLLGAGGYRLYPVSCGIHHRDTKSQRHTKDHS